MAAIRRHVRPSSSARGSAARSHRSGCGSAPACTPGEIEVRPNQDIAGIAVHLAARVAQAAPADAIHVSSTVHGMLLGGDAPFEDRGEHALKGFGQPWRLYDAVR